MLTGMYRSLLFFFSLITGLVLVLQLSTIAAAQHGSCVPLLLPTVHTGLILTDCNVTSEQVEVWDH